MHAAIFVEVLHPHKQRPLLQQGDIESVAAMQPRDVTTLFESISGSEALRKDYEAKQTEKTAAEERVSHITARKRQLGAEKRQVSACQCVVAPLHGLLGQQYQTSAFGSARVVPRAEI